MRDLALDDIQGLILSGYGKLKCSAYLLLRFDDPLGGRRWLGELLPQVTTSLWEKDSKGKPVRPHQAVNIALTCFGLRKLGLGASAIETFPQEFQEGMTAQPRPRRMGDTGASAPGAWEFGGVAESGAPPGDDSCPADDLHALLIVQWDDESDQATRALIDGFVARFGDYGIHEFERLRHTGRQSDDEREHFGFRDSISQPHVEGGPVPNRDGQPSVKAGEFVLGYENEYGVLPQTPVVAAAEDAANDLLPAEPEPGRPPEKDLGRNGSFLVLRKLQQDVAAFRRFLHDHAATDSERDALGAKLVGRWRGGAPLAASPDRDDLGLSRFNGFGYAAHDRHGLRCPVGAHVRRANPRDVLNGDPADSRRSVNRHRILRRGVIYGPRLDDNALIDDGVPRGILFLCVNADIERQFEFVQQTWLNNPKFGGAYADSDPIAGFNGDTQDATREGPFTFTLPAEPARWCLHGLPRFVHMRGGGYFFLPSVRALRFLARQPAQPV